MHHQYCCTCCFFLLDANSTRCIFRPRLVDRKWTNFIVRKAPWNAGPFDDDWFLLQVPFHISKRLIQITENKEMPKRVHFTPSANRKSLLNVWIFDTLYANAGKWDIGVSQCVICCGHPYSSCKALSIFTTGPTARTAVALLLMPTMGGIH